MAVVLAVVAVVVAAVVAAVAIVAIVDSNMVFSKTVVVAVAGSGC